MRLSEIHYASSLPIEGYGPGFFRIGGKQISAPLIVSPSGVGSWRSYEDTEGLISLAAEIDLLFIGTGAETRPIPKELQAALRDANIPYEIMGSAAACRTYNVLLAEGRRIAAALLAVI